MPTSTGASSNGLTVNGVNTDYIVSYQTIDLPGRRGCTTLPFRSGRDCYIDKVVLPKPSYLYVQYKQISAGKLNGIDSTEYLCPIIAHIVDHLINWTNQLLPWSIGSKPRHHCIKSTFHKEPTSTRYWRAACFYSSPISSSRSAFTSCKPKQNGLVRLYFPKVWSQGCAPAGKRILSLQHTGIVEENRTHDSSCGIDLIFAIIGGV